MSQNTKPNAKTKPSPMVKLAGVYKQKRARDGKTYLVGRLNYGAKLLILPNDKVGQPHEPDFNVFIVEDEKPPAS